MGDQQSPKLPITPEILIKISHVLNLASPKDSMFWAAILVGFFAFLRKSNLFPPNKGFDPLKHLIREDFTQIPQGLLLRLKWSKTLQFRERAVTLVVPSIPDSPLCPVTAVRQAFSSTSSWPQDPAFSFRVGPVLSITSYREFVARLRSILQILGYPPASYAGHSLRRGGASWAFKCGVPAEFIKMQGDWRSDAYQKYLELSVTDKSVVAQKMGSNLAVLK